MPQIVNLFVQKVLRLVKEFFGANEFEYGIVNLTPADNDKTIFVGTSKEVRRVWFSMTPTSPPEVDEYGHIHGACYVSEAILVPNGFEFTVRLESPCSINWFAIEG